jgi:hypothetical protein
MKKLAFALLLVACASVPAMAAESPFQGTWKLDPEKSRFTGDTFTYSVAPSGLMRYSNGSTREFDFGLDGKPYPNMGGYTVSWTPAGENAWDSEWRLGDKVMGRAHRTLSADGKTLTIESTGFRADGTEAKETDVYTRVFGGPGLPGTWRNIKVQTSSTTYIIGIPAPGQIRIESPADRETVAGPTDGTALPYVGPDTPEGYTISFTVTGPSSLKYTNQYKGKVMNLGTMAVSRDGKTMTQVFWVPGKENEKGKAVYVKQE